MAPPSHLFVIRHGNRLDVVDKEWHRTSPTPYDPPLTYGGWLQSKATGARIASILTSSAAAPAPPSSDSVAASTSTSASAWPSSSSSPNAPEPTKRRRYKVVIHSSPFLRCVQTATAIAAGISQPLPPLAPSAHASAPVATDILDSVVLAACPGNPQQKSLLRLDPFLGEWLAPEYFEGITSPPSSNLMLAGAKAGLLRREDYESTFVRPAALGHGHKPSIGALWVSSSDANGLSSVANVAQALPSTSAPPKTPPSGYKAPMPNYAVGITCPIPKGFVAHARDACVVSDYQWDSSREPFEWGDGGRLPEEWPSMHKRFRKGLQGLVDWYAATDKPFTPVTVTEADGSHSGAEDDTVDDDDNVETVVIVVSHGAGCNAMIGAITNKPVLIDVNVSSLTLATRRQQQVAGQKTSTTTTTLPREAGVSLDQTYEISILANTDHYRPPSGTDTPPLASGRGAATPFRSRVSSMTTYMRPVVIRPSTYSIPGTSPASQSGDQTPRPRFDGTPQNREKPASPTTAAGPVDAQLTSPQYTPKSSAVPAAAPILGNGTLLSSLIDVPRSGLWAPPSKSRRLLDADEDDDLDNMLPDFEHKRLSNSCFAEIDCPERSNSDAQEPGARPVLMPPINMLSVLAQDNEEAIIDLPLAAPPPPRSGLWEGSPRTESKRRWTVNER